MSAPRVEGDGGDRGQGSSFSPKGEGTGIEMQEEEGGPEEGRVQYTPAGVQEPRGAQASDLKGALALGRRARPWPRGAGRLGRGQCPLYLLQGQKLLAAPTRDRFKSEKV